MITFQDQKGEKFDAMQSFVLIPVFGVLALCERALFLQWELFNHPLYCLAIKSLWGLG